jgi:hypothetical protein
MNIVVKMGDDMVRNGSTKNNYELLCDCDTVLGLTCVLPMLEVIQNLSKQAQGRDTFVCDLVTFIILCTNDLYVMYVDPLKRYVSWVRKHTRTKPKM